MSDCCLSVVMTTHQCHRTCKRSCKCQKCNCRNPLVQILIIFSHLYFHVDGICLRDVSKRNVKSKSRFLEALSNLTAMLWHHGQYVAAVQVMTWVFFEREFSVTPVWIAPPLAPCLQCRHSFFPSEMLDSSYSCSSCVRRIAEVVMVVMNRWWAMKMWSGCCSRY